MASFIPLDALVLFTLSATHVLGQSCPCGYQDSSGHVWQEAIMSTFTQNASAMAAVGADWVVATDLQVQGGTATANIQYVTANVFQYNNALGLKASAVSVSSLQAQYEIYSRYFFQRSNILYGSFRMQAQVPDVSGVVFGFFTYITDQQEQDIEFLSSDSDCYQHLYYTNQPRQFSNDTVDLAAAKSVVVPGADFTTFGVHRFDWLHDSMTYSYAGTNNGSSTAITVKVPYTPSEFILNVWSNGDPNFSKGPPMADAIATVQYMHLYFNSTSFYASDFNTQCSAGLQCSV
ncbi:concanavalin A-like lectin/glucanase domain-containing protein [Mycena olivaceomarginata]|nr:concanavalin A-like lectin/glucanase domain-containing protein [Mycena olivaceomarginata]